MFTSPSNPTEERADAADLARAAFCRDLDRIDDAIAEELSEWDGPALAEAIRDNDAERVGRIVIQRVGRKLANNALYLA